MSNEGQNEGQHEGQKVDISVDKSVEQYIQQMTPLEMVAYEIAKKQLKSSFSIEKSIGYIKYLK